MKMLVEMAASAGLYSLWEHQRYLQVSLLLSGRCVSELFEFFCMSQMFMALSISCNKNMSKRIIWECLCSIKSIPCVKRASALLPVCLLL